jgi:hypothetical protein
MANSLHPILLDLYVLPGSLRPDGGNTEVRLPCR